MKTSFFHSPDVPFGPHHRFMAIRSMAVIALFALALPALAQIPPDNTWCWGVQSGVNFSRISDIRETIIPARFNDTTYEADERYRRWVFTGGAFFYRRFKESWAAFQPEISFSFQGSNFKYKDQDTISPLTYNVLFKYQYINLLPLFKFYPLYQKGDFWKGFHFGLGPQLGFNVTGSKIKYTSTPDPQYDLYISEAMSEVLKGRTDVAAVLELGYDRWFDDKAFSINFNARWHVGIVDMIETQANGFGFLEKDNFSHHFQGTFGATFLLIQEGEMKRE